MNVFSVGYFGDELASLARLVPHSSGLDLTNSSESGRVDSKMSSKIDS